MLPCSVLILSMAKYQSDIENLVKNCLKMFCINLLWILFILAAKYAKVNEERIEMLSFGYLVEYLQPYELMMWDHVVGG